jgi:ferredoxin
MAVKIDANACVGCGTCVSVCPQEALSLDPKTKKAKVDGKKCVECLVCIDECPSSAILEPE